MPSAAAAATAKRRVERSLVPSIRQQLVANFLFGVWFVALFTIGLYLFAKGFLLTRATLSHVSDCQVPPLPESAGASIPGGDSTLGSHATAPGPPTCWQQRPARFQKALVVIIDALRFDFTLPFDTLPNTVPLWNASGQLNPQYVAQSFNAQDQAPFHAQFHGRLPVLGQLARDRPAHARLYRFMADPPTTTLQRLKGLTTGTLPTFIDMGSNFSGSEIREDTWVSQLLEHWLHANKTMDSQSDKPPGHWSPSKKDILSSATSKPLSPIVVFMGDDTWTSLFPTIFASPYAQAHPFPSFNVWDLHTVDNGVLDRLEHILPLRSSPLKRYEVGHTAAPMSSSESGVVNTEWRLAIAHLLGVDHCGHRFGPDHPTMADKLDQMNAMLAAITEAMDDDTLLVVMGDHGMDLKGDHGGDSLPELEAGLFLYSRSTPLVEPALLQSPPIPGLDWAAMLHEVDTWVRDESLLSFVQGADHQLHRSITQTDLVPTLSLLLGLPIPFNNLGMAIPELFLHSLPHDASAGTAPWSAYLELLRVMRLNGYQILRYIDTYARLHPSTAGLALPQQQLLKRQLHAADAQLAVVEAAFTALNKTIPDDQVLVPAIQRAFTTYMQGMRDSVVLCRRMWAQFDLTLMVSGLLFMLLSGLALLVMVARATRVTGFQLALQYYELITVGAVLGVGVGFLALNHWTSWQPLVWQQVLTALTGDPNPFSVWDTLWIGAGLGSALGWLGPLVTEMTRQLTYWWAATVDRTNGFQGPPMPGLAWLDYGVLVALATIHALAFASNCLVVFEDRLVAYLLQSGMVYVLARVFMTLSSGGHRIPAVHTLGLYGLGFLVLTRLTAYATVCREEQMPYCTPTFYASATSTLPPPYALTGLLALAVVGPKFIASLLRQTDNHHGLAWPWFQFGMRLLLLLVAAYWVLDTWEAHETAVSVPAGTTGQASDSVTVQGEYHEFWDAIQQASRVFSWHSLKLMLARLTLGLGLVVAPLAWSRQPFCLSIDAPQAPSACAAQPASPVSVTVRGRQNSLGASHLTFVTMLFTALVLVQLPMGGVMLFGLLVQAQCLLQVFSALDALTQTSSITGPLPTRLFCQSAQAILLGLLGWHYFFATGHQAVIASIQWPAAFIGLTEMWLVPSALLVTANTLGSFVLVAWLLPLAVYWWRPWGDQHATAHLEPTALAGLTEAQSADGQVVTAAVIPSQLGVQVYLYLLYHIFLAITATLFAAHFRRHLMVWKVFAPRFMLAGPVILLTAAVLLVGSGGWLAYRILTNHQRFWQALQARTVLVPRPHA
ncbi:mannose-ethanolamine phosphotransferase gpi13 [Dimargaris verticillata]|uniref:Mannose-ethanolamine phosphotransferase gpi13 n=1 Tax=Dimargaris verticillata TaxID=2761393 RepID=A0A9W8B133_9FUNG|nr:mannose-ethanolamine phosphotransferase gpi13 [Dimargaris verticillata]